MAFNLNSKYGEPTRAVRSRISYFHLCVDAPLMRHNSRRSFLKYLILPRKLPSHLTNRWTVKRCYGSREGIWSFNHLTRPFYVFRLIPVDRWMFFRRLVDVQARARLSLDDILFLAQPIIAVSRATCSRISTGSHVLRKIHPRFHSTFRSLLANCHTLISAPLAPMLSVSRVTRTDAVMRRAQSRRGNYSRDIRNDGSIYLVVHISLLHFLLLEKQEIRECT